MNAHEIPDFSDFMEESIRLSINEHHGDDWSPEFLNQSVGRFLTKLKKIDEKKYEEVEKIIGSVISKSVNSNLIRSMQSKQFSFPLKQPVMVI